MQRNQSERGPERRNNAERDASQPIDGQPRTDDDETDLEKPEEVPSFLTAQELQARGTGKASQDGDTSGDETPGEPVASKGKAKKR